MWYKTLLTTLLFPVVPVVPFIWYLGGDWDSWGPPPVYALDTAGNRPVFPGVCVLYPLFPVYPQPLPCVYPFGSALGGGGGIFGGRRGGGALKFGSGTGLFWDGGYPGAKARWDATAAFTIFLRRWLTNANWLS